jgi:hypothetical protein
VWCWAMYSGKSYWCHLYGMKKMKACVMDIGMELPSVIWWKILCRYVDTICCVWLYIYIYIYNIMLSVWVFLSLMWFFFFVSLYIWSPLLGISQGFLRRGFKCAGMYCCVNGPHPRRLWYFKSLFYFMQSFSKSFQIMFQSEIHHNDGGKLSHSVQSHMSLQTDLPSECLPTDRTHKALFTTL